LSWKQALRAVLPAPATEWLRESRLRARVFYARHLGGKAASRSAAFSEIYAKHLWGRDSSASEFFSGDGSTSIYTREYEAMVAQFIERKGIASVLDVGCGDFQVWSRIAQKLTSTVNYCGVDVVKTLIDRNQKQFSSETTKFLCLDAAEGALPNAELLLIREVLQHLSVQSVSKIVAKLAPFKYVIVTEHCALRPRVRNVDLPDGPIARVDLGSGTYLDWPPFCVVGEEILKIDLPDGRTCLRSFLIDPQSGSGRPAQNQG
jgi:SAM-dependent methyltransferase